MTRDTVGVGIIGAGMIGSLHAENLAKGAVGAEVAAVMDLDETRAAAVAAACQARQYADAAELIAEPAVQAVLIASPDSAHAEQAIACLEAGKPVLCEKPLATSVADAQRVLAAEMAAGRRLLQVGFMRVYDRAHADVHAMLRRGDIGAALRFRGTHFNPRRGEILIDGALVNSLIHDMHSARWLMRDEIESVYTQWHPSDPAKPETARFAIVQLRFAGGALGTLEWSGDSAYGYEVAMEVTGERGTLQTHSHSSPILRGDGRISQAVTPDWPERFSDAYRAEAQAWIDSVQRGEATGPSAWDGFVSLAVAEACLRSAASGLPELVGVFERPARYAG